MSNPWAIDYFNPPTPHVEAPKPVVPKPKHAIPGTDQLFKIQDDLIRAVNALDVLKQKPQGLSEVERNVQNAYRLINRYLKEHA